MKTFEQAASGRVVLGAVSLVLCLTSVRTLALAGDEPADALVVLRNWAESKDIKWPSVKTLRLDPVTRAHQAAVEDGNNIIGVCCIRLPDTTEPSQRPAVEGAYKEQTRLAATVEALTMTARPVVKEWKVEQGEFSDKLAAFVARTKLLAALPPDVTTQVGVFDGWACSYVRVPKPKVTPKTLLDRIDKDAMLRDFSTWVTEQGIVAVSRESYREALSLFALAHKADAYNTAYLSHALRCYARLGRTDDFDKIVRAVLRESGYPARLYLECGRVCHEQGELEDAIQLYAQVASGSPERPEADAAMVSAYVAIQQRSLATAPATAPAEATSQPAPVPEEPQ